jgi:hypothetical protein
MRKNIIIIILLILVIYNLNISDNFKNTTKKAKVSDPIAQTLVSPIVASLNIASRNQSSMNVASAKANQCKKTNNQTTLYGVVDSTTPISCMPNGLKTTCNVDPNYTVPCIKSQFNFKCLNPSANWCCNVAPK